MRVSRPKVKHLTGSFRGSPLFPEREDIEYVILKWHHLEGGRATMPKKLQSRVVFTSKVLEDRVGPGGAAQLAAMEADGSVTRIDDSRFSLDRALTYELTDLSSTDGKD